MRGRATCGLRMPPNSRSRRTTGALGEPLTRAADLDETLPVPADLPSDPDQLVKAAVEKRSELKVLDEQATAYGQLAKTERSRVLPQLSLTGAYSYLENTFLDDEDFASVGVGVQWAVFDGGQARKRAAALDRSRRATEQQRADVESLIALQVRQSWLDVDETRQRIQVTAGAVEQAEENLRIARERYGAGLGTQTQLLEAEIAARAGAAQPGQRRARRGTREASARACGRRALARAVG